MGRAVKIVAMGEGDEALADGLSLQRSTLDPAPETSRHAHAFHQVTLILSGPGRSRWDFGVDRVYSGRPVAGDIAVCPAFVPMLARWERPFEGVSVRISTQLLDRVAGRSGLEAGVLRPEPMRRDRFAGEVIRKLAEASVDGHSALRGLLAESLGVALAVHLLREYADDGRRPAMRPAALSSDVLRRVDDRIERELDGDTSIARLAAVAGFSPHHFIRRFKAATGMTPHQYVIRRRVEKARELLVEGRGIADVATRVGFSGQSHLNFHVRRLLGVTPGELTRGSGPATGRPR